PHRDPVQAGGPDRRCRQPSVRAAELDAFVWGQIREALLRPELLWAGEKAVVNATGPSDDEVLAVQLARFERELARTAAEKARLFDGYSGRSSTSGGVAAASARGRSPPAGAAAAAGGAGSPASRAGQPQPSPRPHHHLCQESSPRSRAARFRWPAAAAQTP